MVEKTKSRYRKAGTERTSYQAPKADDVSFSPDGMLNFTEMFKSLSFPQNLQNNQVYENPKLMSDIGKLFFNSMMKFNYLLNSHTNSSYKTGSNAPHSQSDSQKNQPKSTKGARNPKNVKQSDNLTVSESNTNSTAGHPSGQYRKQNKNKAGRQSLNVAKPTDSNNDRLTNKASYGKQNHQRLSSELLSNNLTSDLSGIPKVDVVGKNLSVSGLSKAKNADGMETLSLDTHRLDDNKLFLDDKLTARVESGDYPLLTECENLDSNFTDFQAPTPNNNEKHKLNLNIYRFINNCVSINESTTADTLVDRPDVSTVSSMTEASEATANRQLSYLNTVKMNTSYAEQPTVQKAADEFTSTDQDTFLMHCFSGDLESVKKLKGIDLEFVDQVGRSAIHYACTSGNLELVKYLVSNKVEIDKKDIKGWTPLFIAVVKNHVDIVRLLLDSGADLTLTLRHRCAPTRLTDSHSNPIHFAAIKSNRAMTELLLSRNVDVNQKDSQGITPLSYSCIRGDHEYVSYLLDMGANPTIQDVNGRTSFHSVALGGSLELAKLLHQRVGVKNTQDRWSLTPSKLAKIRGYTELSAFLAHPSRYSDPQKEGLGDSKDFSSLATAGVLEAGMGNANSYSLDSSSVNSDDSDDMYLLLSTTIASALNEPNSDQIYRCLTRLGPDVVKTLFELTLKVEKNGGVTTADGKRPRTPGGVFFTLLKQMHLNNYITKEDYEYIRAAEKERLKSLRNNKANSTALATTRFNNASSRFKCGTSMKKFNTGNNNGLNRYSSGNNTNSYSSNGGTNNTRVHNVNKNFNNSGNKKAVGSSNNPKPVGGSGRDVTKNVSKLNNRSNSAARSNSVNTRPNSSNRRINNNSNKGTVNNRKRNDSVNAHNKGQHV